MRLLLKEIQDRYIQENFKRIQEAITKIAPQGDVTQNVQNITIVEDDGDAERLVFRKVADEPISALRLVYLTSDTNVSLADNLAFNTSLVAGIAISTALTGGEVEIVAQGIVKDPFFSFPLNDILFLGLNGNITNIPPTSGFSTIIGKSLGAGSIFINIEQPIETV